MTHSVFFNLKYAKDSEEEKAFLDAASKLAKIPGVLNLQCVKQISPKNNFYFGITMDFASHEDYDFYSNHYRHVAFVQEYWISSVIDFMEIDYIQI
ncbi:MAG: Dabb family protein [Chitinophagaceae bacterium]